MGARILEGLNLDASQKAKAEVILAEARQNGQASAASTADPQARRKAMRAAMEAAFIRLEPILRPDQRAQLSVLRARMVQGSGRNGQGMTSGVVWILEDGKPTPVSVLVGASDGSNTELVDRSGALKPGSDVITGGGPKAKVQARGPLSAGPRVRM
jgi:HlyD family secretion protein